MAYPQAVTSPDQAGRTVAKLVCLAAFVFLLLYGSDVALTARPDVFLGLRNVSTQGEAPPRVRAYVPLAPGSDVGPVTAEQGQVVVEDHPAETDLSDNDLYQQVLKLRQQLGISLDARFDDEVAAVPLRSVVTFLGGEMQWAGGKATVLGDNDFMVFTAGQRFAERSFQHIPLPAAPYAADQDFYVPLTSLVAAYRLRLASDSATGLYELSRGDQTLRVTVPANAFSIEICRSGRWVEVHYVGKLVKHYGACIGEDQNTPLGEYEIESKAEWPGWRAYWGEYIPGGDPRNPLGARFLRTTARGRVTGWGIGIHGTNQPSSIGQRISGGCVRLLNKDIIEVYEVIPIGTRVTIHE